MIRIGAGQGFWGDWLEAPVRLVEDGPLDYLVLDYLAEVTMSILQKQRQRDPSLGYAKDFPPLVARLAPRLRERGTVVLANAGGVNPLACAREIKRLVPDLRVAVVLGDDFMDRLDDFELRNLDTGEPLSTIRPHVQSANVYLGAFPLAEALGTGAHVIVTGRCADAALVLAPLVHRYGWNSSQLNLLAAGVTAGHIVECGAQCTGGNCQLDWETIPDLANIGYPVVEAEADGTFVVTKQPGTGGRVSRATVTEQLVYEVHDPSRYLHPDVTADFTGLRLEEIGPDRVRVTGCRGTAAPEMLKVSLSYAAGWKAVGTLTYSWPGALAKARAADQIVRQRLSKLGLNAHFEQVFSEYLGATALYGPVPEGEINEVQLRIGVRGPDREAADRFTREMVPLVLSGPPTATGYGDGRPVVREVVAYWPALVSREAVTPRVEVVA